MSENKPDLMAELPLAAYAWRKEGMNGWALGHNPPTPNMPDFDKYEVRELAFRTHHAELEAAVRKAARYDWIVERVEADEVDYMLPSVCRIDFKPGEELNGMHDSLDTAIDQAMHNSAREG